MATGGVAQEVVRDRHLGSTMHNCNVSCVEVKDLENKKSPEESGVIEGDGATRNTPVGWFGGRV